ncbi:MAG: nickel-dependent hydrogenase large subunit [Planctomycetes bacterium]|nr:nickel-dependent hydrogenase large subunit [Planctomycetota bacterium]
MVSKTIVFSPFSRLEGDLQVKVEIEEGRIAQARASGTLYRGFEPMLRGRNPLDALVITCRVCGQCGLAHSAAAAGAIRAIAGIDPPPNATLAGNVMMGIETVLSHLTHFYLSFAPDLGGPPAEDEALRRFLPPAGRSFAAALRAREEILGVLGLFAGKWPNSLAIQPGGTTRAVDATEIRRAQGLLGEFIEFFRERVIGCDLDRWLSLRSAADLDGWLGEGAHAASDLGLFAACALARGLDRMGQWPARFISSASWAGQGGTALWREGVCRREPGGLNPARITEHVAYAWYDACEGGVHPFDGESDPAPERAEAYSWAKAPRYADEPAEAGPLARLATGGDPLVLDLLARYGPSVFVRVIARLHEAMHLLRQIGVWLSEIDPEAPFCRNVPRIESGAGFALVEAPRGVLGHWMRVEEGRIRNYQIITPTGWNLSPRDGQDRPGPLEAALVGTPVPDPDRPVEMSYVVKSFDPCLFCTVH